MKLSEYFEDENTINFLINEKLKNLIDKDNCLELMKEFVEKFYKNSHHFKSKYDDIIQKCFDYAYKNIFYFIYHKNDTLLSLNVETLEEIFEIYFKNTVFKSAEDNTRIIMILMKKRKLNNEIDLLENERKKTINKFSNIFNNDEFEPFLKWKVSSNEPSLGFYKESEPFKFENLDNYEFVLVNHYNNENDSFSIAIKIYRENPDSDKTLNLPIISVISIKELNFKSSINFNCFVLDLKPKPLLCKIENFSLLFVKNGFRNIEYTIEIYLNISYNFSAILSHIWKNFYQFYSLPSMSKLSKNVMNLLIKSSCLNVKSEDEKISAIKNWSKNFNYH